MSATNDEKKLQDLQDKGEYPTTEDKDKLVALVKSILNPNGENPKVDEYINGTFGYIEGVLKKMALSENKEETAEEIAQDLNERFDQWTAQLEEKNKKKEETDQQEAEKPESDKTEATDDADTTSST